MPNGDPWDGFSYLTLTLKMDSSILQWVPPIPASVPATLSLLESIFPNLI